MIAFLTALFTAISELIGLSKKTPIDKAQEGQDAVSDAEKKAQNPRGDVGDLDQLP